MATIYNLEKYERVDGIFLLYVIKLFDCTLACLVSYVSIYFMGC